MQVQFAPQSVKNFAGSPAPQSLTATQETEKRENTGVPQSVPEKKKPLFTEQGDLRLQAAEALVFIQEMTPDLTPADLYYIDCAISTLNRLVDEDHADRAAFQERS